MSALEREKTMSTAKGVIALFLSTSLIMPMVANADPGRDEAHGGYGENCYEHKGKVKCRGGKGHGKAKGGHHSAGGPPPWAPAHGWRRKHGGEDRYVKADDDYVIVEERDTRAVVRNKTATVDVGIDKGTCNRKAIGTVVGGVIGGVIGNQVGKDGNREVATILGVVIGGVVGHKVGSRMDKADHHCTGQALEQARDRQTVRWPDKDNHGEYLVTPQRTYQADGRYCRDYITEYQGPKGTEREKSSACRNDAGAWQKVTM
jgi:surface antigen